MFLWLRSIMRYRKQENVVMMTGQRLPTSFFYLQGIWVTSSEKQRWGVFWSSGPSVSWANGNTVQESWGVPQTCSLCLHPPPPLCCHTSGGEGRTFRSSHSIIMTYAHQRSQWEKTFPPLQNILEGKFTAYEELTEERYDGSSICLSPHIWTRLFPNTTDCKKPLEVIF